MRSKVRALKLVIADFFFFFILEVFVPCPRGPLQPGPPECRCPRWCSDRALPRGGSTARPSLPVPGLLFPRRFPKICKTLCYRQPPGATASPMCPSVCPSGMLERGDPCAGDRARCLCPSALRCQSRPHPFGNVPTAMPHTGWHRRHVNTRGVCLCGDTGGTQGRAVPALLLSPLRPAAGPAAFPGCLRSINSPRKSSP